MFLIRNNIKNKLDKRKTIMQSYFTTIAVADPKTATPPANEAKDGKAQPANPLSGILIPMVIVVGAMMFLQMRNGKKQRKQREDMMNAIKVGDKVVTIGGLHGKIANVKQDTYVIEIASGTKIEIAKVGVGTVVKDDGEAKNIDNKIESTED